jgi:hypothetical protein
MGGIPALKPQQALAIALGLAAAAGAYWYASRPLPPPTAESYIAAKPGRSLAGAAFTVGGRPVACGRARIVLDPGLDDLAAAYPGLIILNTKYLPRLPDTVGLYAFGHECGHQLHGPDEAKADCYAVMRGEAQGWLDAAGIDKICDFWKPFAGDNAHLPGSERCEMMRRCYQSASASRR